MNLTFKGFLRGYCRELTGINTDNLRKLVRAAANNAPRAAEPLFLFALEQGKLDYLLAISEETWMYGDWCVLADEATSFSSATAFCKSDIAPERYARVLTAYHTRKNSAAEDRPAIELMREKTITALEKNKTTRYALCEALSLNKGNVYAFLAGDTSKVSRSTARTIMEYAQSL